MLKTKIFISLTFISFLFVATSSAQNKLLENKLTEIDSILYAHQGKIAIPIIDSLLKTSISVQNSLKLKTFKVKALVQIEKYPNALNLSNLLLKDQNLKKVSLMRTHIERALLFEITYLHKESKAELDIVRDYYKSSTIEKDELYGEYLYRSSSLYKILGEIEKAIEFANQAKKFGYKHNYKNVEATASMLLLDLYTNNGTLTSALEFQLRKRLLLLWKSSNNYSHLGFAYIGFSYYYENQKNYKIAHKYLDSAITIGEKTNNMAVLDYSYSYKSWLFENQGYFNKSLVYFKKYKKASDSLKLLELVQKTTEINAKYNYDKEALQNEVLEQNLTNEKEQKNNLLIGLVILTIFLSSLVFLAINLIKKRKEVKSKNIGLTDALEQNKLLLKELNHRVNNNLALILSLVKFQYYEIDEPKYKDKFQSLEHRIKTIAAAHEQLLYKKENIEGENYDVQEYLAKITNALINISTKNIQLNLDAKNINLNIDTMLPIGILINELMSNSLKHAVFKDKLIIDVLITLQQSNIDITYKDSGTTFKEKINTKSLGISIINSMVKQLKGTINRIDSEYNITLQVKNS